MTVAVQLEYFRELLLRLPGRVVLQGPDVPLVLLQVGGDRPAAPIT